MLFNSNVFLFAFLPITLLGFHLLRGTARPVAVFAWLFAASVFFYGYWKAEYLWLLGLSVLFNYAMGRVIGGRRQKAHLAFAVTVNLVALGIYKYLGFFDTVVHEISGVELGLPHLTLPIGISFFTFTQIAYLVDAYRGEVKEARPVSYGLFVTFFPHLIAGPILHHREMMPQFDKPASSAELWRDSSIGLLLLAIGLFKKVVIADSLAQAASPMFNGAASGVAPDFFTAWSGALAYMMQIYFDFSGYSDMAVGLGLLFGIKLPANFNSPYKSRDIIDFWRRWHMTLSRFLRDYLYFPLGGNRRGPVRRYLNLMIVMTIGGLWHGAGWTFVLWGALHGIYLMINHSWVNLRGPREAGLIHRFAGRALTLLCVLVAWVPFRSASIGTAFDIYHAMFGLGGISLPLEFKHAVESLGLPFHITFFAQNSREDFYIGLAWIVVAGAIALWAPNSLELTARYRPTCDFDKLALKWSQRPAWFARLFSVDGVAAAVLCGIVLFVSIKTMNAAASTEFLYFNF
jgi:D-alanyl-lipoteichoic acid acyltransferase DltB (MBOAT superfamily)